VGTIGEELIISKTGTFGKNQAFMLPFLYELYKIVDKEDISL
jgi:hypothetical protein